MLATPRTNEPATVYLFDPIAVTIGDCTGDVLDIADRATGTQAGAACYRLTYLQQAVTQAHMAWASLAD